MARLPTAGVVAYPAMVSTLALAVGVGWLPSWAGAVHLAALPPLDVAADLRLLLARAPSHPVFAVGLLLFLMTLAMNLLNDRFKRRFQEEYR